MIRTLAAACLMSLAAGAVATSADAKTIFETATFTGVDTGEYIVSNTRYFGVAFTLDKTTEITGIGGQFGGFPSGTIFGAIVSLPSATSFPDFTPSTIEANSLASRRLRRSVRHDRSHGESEYHLERRQLRRRLRLRRVRRRGLGRARRQQ